MRLGGLPFATRWNVHLAAFSEIQSTMRWRGSAREKFRSADLTARAWIQQTTQGAAW